MMRQAVITRAGLLGLAAGFCLLAARAAPMPDGGLWRGEAGGLSALAAQWRARAAQAADRHGLVLRRIVLTGASGAAAAAVAQELERWKGRAITAVNPDDVLAALVASPWVAAAAVERRWPDTLVVSVVPRTAAAVWLNGAAAELVAADGTVLAAVDPQRADRRLLRIAGPRAAAALPELRALADAHPKIFARVELALRVGGRRWDLLLRDGPRILLPESGRAYGPEQALRRLEKWEAEYAVLERALTRIDLRLSDRIFVAPVAQVGGRAGRRAS